MDIFSFDSVCNITDIMVTKLPYDVIDAVLISTFLYFILLFMSSKYNLVPNNKHMTSFFMSFFLTEGIIALQNLVVFFQTSACE